MSYKDVYEGWKADPEGFWMQAAEAVDWIEKPSRALDDSKAPFYRWFSDGRAIAGVGLRDGAHDRVRDTRQSSSLGWAPSRR